MKSQLLENAFSIKNLLYNLEQKPPPGSYHYKADKNYSPQATFFIKSILNGKKGGRKPWIKELL